MKHIIKPGIILFLIAAVITALLGFVRSLTLEPIENNKQKAKQAAMAAVIPAASNFIEYKGPYSGMIISICEAYSGTESLGYAVELATEGYSGKINLILGISKAENKITGMRVTKHSETPGLGALAVKENFYKKFDNKNAVKLNVVRNSPGENDIEAITGATITTKAITDAVNEAIKWYNGVTRQ